MNLWEQDANPAPLHLSFVQPLIANVYEQPYHKENTVPATTPTEDEENWWKLTI